MHSNYDGSIPAHWCGGRARVRRCPIRSARRPRPCRRCWRRSVRSETSSASPGSERSFVGSIRPGCSLATMSPPRLHYRMLADGDAAVPAGGMQEIPNQLATRLPAGTVRLGVTVASTTPNSVTIVDGDEVSASAVVVATDGPSASALLGLAPVDSKAAGCVYFVADEAPTDSKMVILDGTGVGPVLNAAVMSNVAPTYAP